MHTSDVDCRRMGSGSGGGSGVGGSGVGIGSGGGSDGVGSGGGNPRREMLEVRPGAPAVLRVAPRPATAAVAPSPLLARMQEFLPQLAAANAQLGEGDGSTGDGCVEIVAAGGGAGSMGGAGSSGGADGAGGSATEGGRNDGSEEGDGSQAGEEEGDRQGHGMTFAAGVGSDYDSGSGSGSGSGSSSGSGAGPGPAPVFSSGGKNNHAGDSTPAPGASAMASAAGRAVHMDLYVDNTFGELVAREEDAAPLVANAEPGVDASVVAPTRPRIEVLSEPPMPPK